MPHLSNEEAYDMLAVNFEYLQSESLVTKREHAIHILALRQRETGNVQPIPLKNRIRISKCY